MTGPAPVDPAPVDPVSADPDAPPPGPWLLGVRHHGPGSARAVRAVLEAVRPRAVLIEGPPEADALLALAADPAMRPPVALLAHVVDDPRRASFWPMAEFSPEWVALRWALEAGAEVRFIDLPAAHSLAAPEERTRDERERTHEEQGQGRESGRELNPDLNPDHQCGQGPESGQGAGLGTEPGPGTGLGAESGPEAGPESGPGTGSEPDPGTGSASRPGPGRGFGPEATAVEAGSLRLDPLGALAGAAGYDDPESWWEDVVEHRVGAARTDPYGPFEVLGEAMAALREVYGDGGHARDLVREAYMRKQLRSARRAFGDEVAVVCGAWHVPALAARTTAAADQALLKGLPKVKAELTWVPWTHRRLARRSGYGAGVDSPGWYGHLFAAPDRPVERWMTKVAGLLRAEDRPVSSAHVIEAVRLAGTLAALRGRPLPGLTETTDAVRAVMCEGSDVPLALVHDRLVVGDVLGEVPDGAPAVPLQRDLTRTQRTLRLKPEAAERELDLDLRKETDAARSRLLHRLCLLGVGWGEQAAGRGSTGTFRESWRLSWEPELSVRVAEAGVWGTTVLAAATARAEAAAGAATVLGEITSLAERCLLAGLGDALPVVMRALADRAALDTDVAHLAQALPALARTLRYGDVRGTGTEALGEVAAGLAERVCVGLPPACTGLDADGATEMRRRTDDVHAAMALLADAPAGGPGLRDRWTAVLARVAGRDSVPGEIRGRAVRLLLDEGRLAGGEAERHMGLALSAGTPPGDAAAWIEGFVGGASGGGMLLVHDERLLALVDTWLTGVPADAFTDVLPLLRRTFSAYEPGVRRTLGELVRRGPGGTGPSPAATAVPGFGPGFDEERADAVEPLLRLLLGADGANTGGRRAAAGRDIRNTDLMGAGQ
ncbi:DUF5682 family protein [Streptomyces sp. NPDC059070]|uniref:DUF5682 family protein n=1 Tax=Streptomyces sp. NPDC059070 TaxID=3346713 RepID=UPI0036B5F2EC